MHQFSGHTTVIGMTQHGKTYTTLRLLKMQSRGVLFFNTQLEDDFPGYIKVDASTTFAQIRDLLRKGQKLNYVPKTKLLHKAQELTWLIDHLFDNGGFSKASNIFLVVDEVHLFKKEALDNILRVWTSGLRFGINGVSISQRPAEVDNTILTQSTSWLIFYIQMEGQWFKRYGIDYDVIIEKIDKNGMYSYCSFDKGVITDYKKI